MKYDLLCGDCLDIMCTLDKSYFDSIITDPPYGLGFMGKEWDYGVPGTPFWEKALIVAKPGAYMLAFGGTRTFHRLACGIEDAGWSIKDTIMWVYGNGFPQGKDIGKMLDKQGEPFEPWLGWNTVLKPAWEPIIIAQKPISESTLCKNVLKHHVGGLNVSGCSVPVIGGNTDGRYPANLIHDGSEEVVSLFPDTGQSKWTVKGDESSESVKNCYRDRERIPFVCHGDSGSASRFFYCAKVSKSDRGEFNTHPTVKPTNLMRYLCRLTTPVGGIILDPFMGSGSTGKAALLEGCKFVGIDKDQSYVDISRKRLEVL